MKDNDEDRKRIIKICDERKEFVTDVDGFVYWWPEGLNGHLASHHLRWLANELDKRNEKWQKEIDDFFTNNEKPIS
jgi:hypothetical protein